VPDAQAGSLCYGEEINLPEPRNHLAHLPLAGTVKASVSIQFSGTKSLTALPDADTFIELMDRLKAGDEDAAAVIFRRFARRLIGLAQANLDYRIRQKIDPEDVVQSVFKSFFIRQAERAYDLNDWTSLWSLLARITVFKCGHRIEYFQAARRDVRRDAAVVGLGDDSARNWAAVARDPAPWEAAVLVDLVESLMSEMGERDRRIFMFSLQGMPVDEVSLQVGCSERTVHRVLKGIKEQLEAPREVTEHDRSQ
jgi:RNA polymerase sigma-70 factor (ECF subfamily)